MDNSYTHLQEWFAFNLTGYAVVQDVGLQVAVGLSSLLIMRIIKRLKFIKKWFD